MKILNDSHEFTIEQAVVHAGTANPYSYSGQTSKLKLENEQLRDMLARLIECLYGENNGKLNKAQAIEYILGYGYEVAE